MLVLLCGLVRAIKSPDDEIAYENRPAEKFIAPSFSSYTDRSFQDSFESCLSDQVNAAIKMKKMYNIIDSGFALPVIDALASNQDGYVGFRDVWFYKGMLVLKPLSLDDCASALESCAQSINAHIESCPGTEFYVYYIETYKDINLETEEKSGLYEFLLSQLRLEESHVSRLVCGSYDDYSRNFLSTDHHWNATGAYSAYLDICRMLDVQALEAKGSHRIDGKYLGTRAAGIEGIAPGSFDVNIFDYPEMQMYYNSTPIPDYGRQDQFVAGELGTISYGRVFGEDGAELLLNTGKDGENLLVMGDSYDNAIIKALACGFSKTYSVDLRAYEAQSFDLKKYVDEHEIDSVLFIGGYDYFSATLY